MARRIALILVLMALAGCGVRAPGERSLALFCTSDLQSNILGSVQERDGRKELLGGLPRIAAVYAEQAKGYDGALLLSSGDDAIGAFYELYAGAPEMEGMTMAGYRAVCPGNHEFDYGLAIYGKALSRAGFDVLCANLSSSDPAFSKKVAPLAVYNVAGVRVGVFGLITPDLFRLTLPVPDLRLDRDFEAVARRSVARLRIEGCRVVVCLSHMGLALDSQLAGAVPGIDFIVGGHDHVMADKVVNGTRIVQDGSEGTHLGVLSFTFAGGSVAKSSYRTILLDQSVASDQRVAAALVPWAEKYNQGLATPIGELAASLDTSKKALRAGECAAGDLVADSWLAWFPHAQAALVNSGSIRGDRVIPAGPVTYKTVNEMLPFGDSVMSVRLTGKDLLQVLEISASALGGPGDDPEADPARTPTGGLLQAAGLVIEIDPSRKPYRADHEGQVLCPGERVVSARIRQGEAYEKIEPGKTYTVLFPNYIVSGGDGYFLLKGPGIEAADTTMKEQVLLADYIKKHSPVTPSTDGRMVLVP